jgi:hypothetical protein
MSRTGTYVAAESRLVVAGAGDMLMNTRFLFVVMKCPKIDFGGGYKTQNRLKPYNFHHFT